MKITRLEAIPLRPLAMRQAFSTTNVLLNSLHFVLVRIETDAGIEGYGEALPAWEVTGETTDSVEGCVALYQDSQRLYADDLLTGREIGSLAAIREMMDAMLPAGRPFTVMGNAAAKAAIEQAALDACARLNGVSIPALLGITPVPVASAITCGIKPVDETLAWVEAVLQTNPALIRLKVGGRHGADRDAAVVNGARQIIRQSGSNARLAADANEGFVDAERSIAFCRTIEGSLDWLEQPVVGDDRLAFRDIKARTSVPLMADESLHGFGDAEQLVRMGGVDHFNVKLMKAGGLLSALRIIDFAAAHGISCHIGSMIETSLGCLMGYCAAAARPSHVIGTDMLAFAHLDAEPWRLLREDEGKVVLSPDVQSGSGVSEAMVRQLARAGHDVAKALPAA